MSGTTLRGAPAVEPGDVALVPFAAEHLPGALRLSQEMGWPYRLEDWAVALELGRGFVLRDRAGGVVATAAWWPCGDNAASAGMIIVTKAAQGRGHGARLMDALLAAAQPRTVTLNSTAEGLALYARRGFVAAGVVHQHQGVARGRHAAPPGVRAIGPADAEAVARLDREATGWSRWPILERLLQIGTGDVLVRDGEPRGYAITRRFGRGHVIGPVAADSPGDARALIEAALARLGAVFVRIDTGAISQLGAWLEEIGLQRVDAATTMVRGTRMPPAGPAHLYALASQSFN